MSNPTLGMYIGDEESERRRQRLRNNASSSTLEGEALLSEEQRKAEQTLGSAMAWIGKQRRCEQVFDSLVAALKTAHRTICATSPITEQSASALREIETVLAKIKEKQ